MDRNPVFDPSLSDDDNVRLTPEYRGGNGLTYSLELKYFFVEEFDVWVPCAQRIHVNRGQPTEQIDQYTLERAAAMARIAPQIIFEVTQPILRTNSKDRAALPWDWRRLSPTQST